MFSNIYFNFEFYITLKTFYSSITYNKYAVVNPKYLYEHNDLYTTPTTIIIYLIYSFQYK